MEVDIGIGCAVPDQRVGAENAVAPPALLDIIRAEGLRVIIIAGRIEGRSRRSSALPESSTVMVVAARLHCRTTPSPAEMPLSLPEELPASVNH